jgi:hypothetical protein
LANDDSWWSKFKRSLGSTLAKFIPRRGLPTVRQ